MGPPRRPITGSLPTREDLLFINKLPHVKGAGYRSTHHDTCMTGTRSRELQLIEEWEADEAGKRVYWLNGMAGTGKSAIAKTFAERSSTRGRLGASFFCSRDFEDKRNINLIFPTLAYDLAFRYPEFKAALIPIISSDPDVGYSSLPHQLQNLLVQPLKSTGLSTTIVVDALDECEESNPASEILSLLAQHIDSIPSVKFFLTGRPEPPIRSGFRLPLLRPHTDVFVLHEVDRAFVDRDIELYLRTRLLEIASQRDDVDASVVWPTEEEASAAVNKCSGLFLLAAVIARIVSSPRRGPQEWLNFILSRPDRTVYEGRSVLDEMYHHIFHEGLEDIDIDDNDILDRIRVVVGSIVLAFNPLSCADLARMLDIPSESVRSAIRSLHSVLVIPDSDSQPVHVFHNSLTDFLTDPSRCTDTRFFIEPSIHHFKLGTCCLKWMNRMLKKNMCDLPPNAMNKDIEDLGDRRQTHVGDGLQYACKWWAKHLRFASEGGDSIGQIIELLEYFFEHRLSPWLETLSIMGNMSYGVSSLRDVRDWLVNIGFGDASLLAVIEDAESFVRTFSDSIEASASHVYQCDSSWSPKSPLVRALGKKALHSERGRPYPPPSTVAILEGAGGIPMLPKSKPVREDITDSQKPSQSHLISGAPDETAVVYSNPSASKSGSDCCRCCVLQ